MTRVFAIGETVYDIIFKNNVPVTARAGGSMLNTATSLGRLGVETYFISEYGSDQDPIGKIINDFLHANQVNTDLVSRSEDKKSNIALAFLNENSDASYSFYRNLPNINLDFSSVTFKPTDIVLFGSFFSLTAEVRPLVLKILSKACDAGSLVMYDPNFRKPHADQLPQVKPMIIENLRFADLVRGSDEDFHLIFGSNNVEDAFQVVSLESSAALIYTKNRNGVDLISQDIKLHSDVPYINPISTIGAGDNFNAGVIWTLVREELTKKDLEHLTRKQWGKMLENGIRFAADVCMTYDNYISLEFTVDMLKE